MSIKFDILFHILPTTDVFQHCFSIEKKHVLAFRKKKFKS